MARVCSICGKTPIIGRHRLMLRSRYNPSLKIRKYPNLQWTVGPSGKRIKVCARCLKTISAKKTKSAK